MKSITRVVVVIGTRPEAIKLAPLVWAAQSDPRFELKIIRTGQHRELVDPLMNELGLVADANLDVMEPKQQLSHVLSASVRGLSDFLVLEKPDWVLVQGDTTSALAGALAGFYNKIQVGHVEAGLRTGDPHSPFPEEVNRALIARLASMHFVPTERARLNLLNEAIQSEDIILTGNTVVDAILQALQRTPESRVRKPESFVLVTVHRRENLGQGLLDICDGLLALLKQNRTLHAVMPMHPNPKVRDVLLGRLGKHSRITLTEAMGYIEFIHNLRDSTVVITDSGGVQEECAVLCKPVLVVRALTERQEAVDAGVSILTGTDPKRIVEEGTKLLRSKSSLTPSSRTSTLFGDGNAASRILHNLLPAACSSQRPKIEDRG